MIIYDNMKPKKDLTYEQYGKHLKQALESEHKLFKKTLASIHDEIYLTARIVTGVADENHILKEKYDFVLNQLRPKLLELTDELVNRQYVVADLIKHAADIKELLTLLKAKIKSQQKVLRHSIKELFDEDFTAQHELIEQKKLSVEGYEEILDIYDAYFHIITHSGIELKNMDHMNKLLEKIKKAKITAEQKKEMDAELALFQEIRRFMIMINDYNKHLEKQNKNSSNLAKLLTGISKTQENILPFLHYFIMQLSKNFAKEMKYLQEIMQYEQFKKQFFVNLSQHEAIGAQVSEQMIQQQAEVEEEMRRVHGIKVKNSTHSPIGISPPYYDIESEDGRNYRVFPIKRDVFDSEGKKVYAPELVAWVLEQELIDFVTQLREAAQHLEQKLRSIERGGGEYRIVVPTMGAIPLYIVMRFFARSIDENKVFYMPASSSLLARGRAVQNYFFSLFNKLEKKGQNVTIIIIDEVVSGASVSKIIASYGKAFDQFMKEGKRELEEEEFARKLRSELVLEPLRRIAAGAPGPDVARQVEEKADATGIEGLRERIHDFIDKARNGEINIASRDILPDKVKKRTPNVRMWNDINRIIREVAAEQIALLYEQRARELFLNLHVIGIHDMKDKPEKSKSRYIEKIEEGRAKQFDIMRLVLMDNENLDIAKYKQVEHHIFTTLHDKKIKGSEVELIKLDNEQFIDMMDKMLDIIEKEYPADFKKLMVGTEHFDDLDRHLRRILDTGRV
jgi:hypothetical protein